MQIWNKLKTDPEGLIDWHSEWRLRLETENKLDVYNQVRKSSHGQTSTIALCRMAGFNF